MRLKAVVLGYWAVRQPVSKRADLILRSTATILNQREQD